MARARGKVILLGEHAVVYGVPALAVGIERGAHAVARPAETPRLNIGDRSTGASEATEISRAFAALLAALDAPALELSVTLELPPGCGLGASAAIAVAAARAVLDQVDPSAGDAPERPERAERVLRAAHAWESVFHGNPSGVDAAAAASGGCIAFTRGESPSPVQLGAPLELVVAVAGPPASTKVMVEGVARLRERRPEVVNKALEGIRALVNNARLAIEAGDLPALGKLMDLNQMLLSGLFLSTEDIERAVMLARDAGALGAKLTGSGGGGCVIALTSGGAAPILAAWQGAGLRCFETVVTDDTLARGGAS
jgi:mevalonate kinase